MHQAIFLYDPLSDGAALSGGSWQRPLAALQNGEMADVARSIDAAPASTIIRVALPRLEMLRALVLGPSNLTTVHRYRIRAFSDASFTTVMHDTGWIQPMPPTGQEQMEWEDPDYWLGLQSWRDPERGLTIQHVLDGPVTARWWQIDVSDETNPAGYLEFSRLFMARTLRPSINYDYGAALALLDNSLRASLLSGGERIRRRKNPRRFTCAFPSLPEGEGFGNVWRMITTAGFDGEVFVIPDPLDREFAQRRGFFGRLTVADPITQSAYLRIGTAFELKEII